LSDALDLLSSSGNPKQMLKKVNLRTRRSNVIMPAHLQLTYAISFLKKNQNICDLSQHPWLEERKKIRCGEQQGVGAPEHAQLRWIQSKPQMQL
jgi:hypothetical protein